MKFVEFTAPDKTKIHVNPRQVAMIALRLVGPGSKLSLSSGQTQDVLELPDQVLADLKGTD